MSRDLVAAEGHYHRCYRGYTRGESVESSDGMEQGENAETQYEAADKHAHEELLAYIRN